MMKDTVTSGIMSTTFPMGFYNISDEVFDDDYEEFYDRARFWTGLVCYPIVCLSGLTGNILILVVLYRKSMRTSTNVFLSALAVSDTVKLVNDFLYFVTCLLLDVQPPAGNKLYAHIYPYAHFVFNMSVCVSSWLTVSVALERYVLVCHPTRAMYWTSIGRARTISACVFVLMTLLAIPSGLRYRTVAKVATIGNVTSGADEATLDVELTGLWRDETFVQVYNWIQSLLRSIVPLVVLVVTSGLIVNALRRTRANRKRKSMSRQRISVMLIVVIAFFVVCITPDAVMSACYLGYAESDSYLVKGVREITDCLLVLHAAVTFPLYVVFNRGFREEFFALCCHIPKPDRKSKYIDDRDSTFTKIQLRQPLWTTTRLSRSN